MATTTAEDADASPHTHLPTSTTAAPPPFPKDCKACAGAQHLLHAFARLTTKPTSAPLPPPPTSTDTHPTPRDQSPPLPPTPTPASPTPLPCPPDTAKLGKSAWTFLHTTAAYYPANPSTAQQSLMRSMMDGLAEFYPCHYCAAHLREQFKSSPPRVGSAQELSLWLCGIHNEVNQMLGKPAFDCSRVFERWKDGPADGSCD